MPLGLWSKPASFQHQANQLPYSFDKCYTAYLDILVYSQTEQENRCQVREVVTRPSDSGLRIDTNKRETETSRSKYLGLAITSGGIEWTRPRLKKFSNCKITPSLKDSKTFLGLCQLLPLIHSFRTAPKLKLVHHLTLEEKQYRGPGDKRQKDCVPRP